MDWPGAFPEVISTGQTGWLGEWTETGIEGGPATSSGTWITLDVPEEGSASSESFIFLESSRAIGPSDPDDPFYQQLDVVAPGAAIYQPNASRGASSPDSFNSYRGHPLNFLFGYGTSLASPHVAGIAALMMQKNRAMGNPDLTQAQVEAILKCSAIPVVKGTHTDPLFSDRVSEWGDNCVDPDPSDSGVCREEQGYGLVQADRALDCIGSGGELSCVVSIDPLECASP
jgi:subtilisin family serine protease